MKVYVFENDFLTDWSDGLGVIFADSRKSAINKMAELVAGGDWSENIPKYIKQFSQLDIKEYTLENFPGAFTFGGA